MVTNESQVHENYKDMIIKARDIDSRVTGRTTGHPVRALRNQMTKDYLEKEKEGASFEELELLTLGGLRRAVVDGDVKTGSVMAGQIAGMVKEKMSCHDLIRKLVKETDDLIGGKDSMSKTAFLFPGQGAQKAGMGRIFMNRVKTARNVVDRAAECWNRYESIVL